MKSDTEIRINIVEDNQVYSFILENILRRSGNFKIDIFASAEKCIEMLDSNPDVIILDYFLDEGMNGMEAFKIIQEKKPGIPVIVLSGQPDTSIASDFLKMGAFDYIYKGQTNGAEIVKNSVMRAISEK